MSSIRSYSSGADRPRLQVSLLHTRDKHYSAYTFTRECFMNYVGTKVAKKMESYRVRNASLEQPRTVLLPLSLGVSSITLLHILDRQINTQLERTSRTGYSIHVLMVDESVLNGGLHATERESLLKQRYPRHVFSVVPLEDVFDSHSYPDLELPKLGMVDAEYSALSNERKLQDLMASLPSATSRSDIANILRARLVVSFSKHHGCDSTVWGDSTTRLAEKTLSETAKGRGFSLPWQTADGPTPHGIAFHYPLRDLLKKELVTYSTLTSPSLTPLIIPAASSAHLSASSKDTTIDDLMTQYFESVEQNYPSIVANVVRTSSRLEAPTLSDGFKPCTVCGLPVVNGTQGLHGWGGDQAEKANEHVGSIASNINDRALCYGCARSTLNP